MCWRVPIDRDRLPPRSHDPGPQSFGEAADAPALLPLRLGSAASRALPLRLASARHRKARFALLRGQVTLQLAQHIVHRQFHGEAALGDAAGGPAH